MHKLGWGGEKRRKKGEEMLEERKEEREGEEKGERLLNPLRFILLYVVRTAKK